ncbi:alternate-type signal peptide domain-containing protein [Rhodococcus sp. SJ-3]|uniref:alternate-type signal peptide domain-containing protein n=1 Tax=Rhodococcus sp. SJ-3 TaxID=3454628 RepID=UPI003F79BE79
MNKKTKAAVAAGAGAILLLGGVGTLAFWSDEADLGGGGTITSGQLTLGECAGGGTWTNVNAGTTIADISSFRIVPGDTVEYTCDTTLTAEGDNLTATLTADLGAVTGDAELLAALQRDVTATLNGTTLPASGEGVQVVANDGSDQPISVGVTIAFDPGTTGTTGQGQTVDLAEMSLNLEQNPNPAPA